MLSAILSLGLPTVLKAASNGPDGCSAKDFDINAKIDAVKRAPNCQRAYAIMKHCALGASGDVAVGEVVRKKCERLFLPELGPVKRRTYHRELKRCSDKYANEMGTMYQSMAAFCETEHAVRIAAPYESRR